MDEGHSRPPSPCNTNGGGQGDDIIKVIERNPSCEEFEMYVVCEPSPARSEVLSNKRIAKRPRRNSAEQDGDSGDDNIFTEHLSKNTKRLINKHNKRLSGTRTETNTYEVALSSYELMPKQIGLAKLLKNENIPNILSIKYKNPYKVLIVFEKKEDADILINNKKIMDLGYRCHSTSEVGISYGIVRYIELSVAVEEIEKSFHSEAPIVSVKRLKRLSDDGKWVDSETMRFGFKSSFLPPFVYGYECRFKIEPYMFPVTQCPNCWNFGHLARTCPMKRPTCPKCSGEHDNCETRNFRCVNCRGLHTSFNKICPVYIKEREIRLLMSKYNCTYKVALCKYLENKSDLAHVDAIPEPQPISFVEHHRVDGLSLSYSQSVGAKTIQTEASVHRESKDSDDVTDEDSNGSEECILGKSISNESQRKRKRNKKRKAKIDSHDENDITERSEPNTSEGKREKNSFLRSLIRKSKDIILSPESIEMKIKQVVKLLFDEIISFVVESISNGEALKKLFCFLNNG